MNKTAYVLAALSALAATAAAAQQYPTKPVRLLVGFAPGGGTDIVARVLGQKLSEWWGQQVIVENRAGATGTIAADLVAKAAPDGYTLLMGHVNSNAIAPSIFRKLPYDAVKDFASVTYVSYVNKALQEPTVRKRLVEVGTEIAGGSTESFDAFIRSEIAKYSKLVKAANVQLD